ncbi:uncharacterized protein [Amphiura filiformis]|uniref:uncharacterized protein n=1 Tax=Amphiura filiformis TaxID=82378 RepID=UPI003B21CECD
MAGNSPVDESELRCLANDLGAEWEALATFLGCTASDIQKFKITRQYHDISLVIFDMLLACNQRHAEEEQRSRLANALQLCDRLDLAQLLTSGSYLSISPTPIVSPSADLNVDQCRDDLCWTYLNDVCRLPIYPWDKSNCIDIKDVFTNLSIILDLPSPFKALKIPLSSYEEVFSQKKTDGNPANRLIIQGEAGTGKSTLTAKFAYDWANCEGTDSLLKHKKLLFLLRMRDLDLSTNIEDAIIKHLLPEDTSITRSQLRRYLEQHGEDCCVILDGLDESCYEDLDSETEGNIASILSCRTLRKCLVLVTSRPDKLGTLDDHRKHYMNYEVTGFTDDEVGCYIRKFFGDEDVVKARNLLDFIESNSMKIGMATTPLVTHLLCLYWKHMDSQDGDENEHDTNAPTTMTKLLNALLNFMHDHYVAKGTSSSQIDLDNIVLELGKIALNALWPPASQLVFTEDDVVQKTSRTVVTDAYHLGIITTRHGIVNNQAKFPQARSSGSLSRSNLRTKTLERKKLEFFHKLGQEHCAGHYLAHIADSHPLEFERKMSSLHKPNEVLSLSFVLLSACGNSEKCAEGIMHRLNVVYFAEIWKYMNRFVRGKLSADESRNIQQFIELCIQCNLEGEATGKLNDLLLKFFPWKKVAFTGLPSQTAVAFRYFLQYLKNPEDIEHVFVNGVPRRGIDFINDSTFETLSENVLQKYDQAASRLNVMELDRALQGLELPSIDDLAKTQLYQAFEKWEIETPSSVIALLDKLDCVALKTLNLRHLRLADASHRLFDIIGSGGLRTLTRLDLANTGLTNDNVLQLAGVIQHLTHLQDIILFSNKADNGLVPLSLGFTGLKLRWIDLSLMGASTDSMHHLCSHIPQFGLLLNALHLDGNDVDDDCLGILTTSLSKLRCLQRVSVSPSVISNPSCFAPFLESLRLVTDLQALQITVNWTLCSTFLRMVSQSMAKWRQVEDLQLGCCGTDDEMDTEGVGDTDELACKTFLEGLDEMANLHWLDLVRIRLPTRGFENLVQLCRRHNYKRLQYNRSCLPEVFNIPRDKFLVFI